MTSKYKKVYIKETSTVTGPVEKEGPLYKEFDKSYDDLYMGEKTWEKAERRLMTDSINILLEKIKLSNKDIDLMIGGDLLDQIVTSNYNASYMKIPFIGVYSACASSTEGIIIGSTFIENKDVNNVLCTVASHNASAEKQFRYPTEYGSPRPKISTWTSTGSGSLLLTDEKTKIKVESSTIGTVIDLGINDPFNLGAAMAPAAAHTVQKHLKDMKRQPEYYDLILTGDLGEYGSKILIEYMKVEYKINIEGVHKDSALMLFNRNKQTVYAGGSGPACLPLVAYSHIFNDMKKGKLKKVLLVATGALFSKTMIVQKETIPCVAHAVSLEAII